MRRNPTTHLILFILIALAAVLFSGACSSKPGSDPDLPAAPASDLPNHPIYSSYNFGEDERVIDIGTQPIGVSPGIIGEILEHDAVLRAGLVEFAKS